jgi:CheY-like chemotaxis protein
VEEAHVFIEVTDNGIGMTSDLTKHVFDLFTQAERTSDRSSGGLGLGLALVKSLVELHGGTVTCTSGGLGEGSTFRVCLPRLHQQEQLFPGQIASDNHRASDVSLRILVVDDNVDAAAMLAMLLETQGHEVLIEHGSYQALERARLEKPQVCLLDIGLPEIDGNELAQRLRALPETRGAVLIAVTGYGQQDDRESTLATGFRHHLVKPVDTKKLLTILDNINTN